MQKKNKKVPVKPDLKKFTPQEELFCNLYSRSGETFGNASLSYAIAYGKDYGDPSSPRHGQKSTKEQRANGVCRFMGSSILARHNILKRCEEILAETIADTVVDKELKRVILQNTEVRAKVAAIAEYNKLHGRITEKHKHEFEGVSTEEIEKRAAEIIARVIEAGAGTGNQKE